MHGDSPLSLSGQRAGAGEVWRLGGDQRRGGSVGGLAAVAEVDGFALSRVHGGGQKRYNEKRVVHLSEER